jgi:hypothetical protein
VIPFIQVFTKVELKPNNMQTTLQFETASPINADALTGQNKRVYEWLASGHTINCIQAQTIGITALNSRISDLRNRSGVQVYDRFITLPSGTKVKEYSLKSFFCND